MILTPAHATFITLKSSRVWKNLCQDDSLTLGTVNLFKLEPSCSWNIVTGKQELKIHACLERQLVNEHVFVLSAEESKRGAALSSYGRRI